MSAIDLFCKLATVEKELGSLLPNVRSLLIRALEMEDDVKESSEMLLQDSDVYLLLQTIKEKLTGIVILADICGDQDVHFLRQLISRIECVLNKTNKINILDICSRKRAHEVTDNAVALAVKKICLPSYLFSKLTNALEVHGYESMPNEDLLKLAHFFMMLAKMNIEKIECDGQNLKFSEVLSPLDIFHHSANKTIMTPQSMMSNNLTNFHCNTMMQNIVTQSNAQCGTTMQVNPMLQMQATGNFMQMPMLMSNYQLQQQLQYQQQQSQQYQQQQQQQQQYVTAFNFGNTSNVQMPNSTCTMRPYTYNNAFKTPRQQQQLQQAPHTPYNRQVRNGTNQFFKWKNNAQPHFDKN